MSTTFTGPLKPHVPGGNLTNSAASPGPGAYNSTSSFGRMAESKKNSNPQSKFGTSLRESSNRQYISPKHQKSMPSSYSNTSFYGDLESTSTLGKMSSSKLRTNPKFGFGSATRFTQGKGSSTKNVGYSEKEYGSTGKQVNSKKKSSPSFGFGTQERDRYNKMYLSKKHAAKSISNLTAEADFMGETSGMGKQTTSKRKTSSKFGFGTSSRAHNAKVYCPKDF